MVLRCMEGQLSGHGGTSWKSSRGGFGRKFLEGALDFFEVALAWESPYEIFLKQTSKNLQKQFHVEACSSTVLFRVAHLQNESLERCLSSKPTSCEKRREKPEARLSLELYRREAFPFPRGTV